MCTWPFVLLSHILSTRCRRRLQVQASAPHMRSFGQTVARSGANESSVSPFPRNLAGSRASFPPDSVKPPKIPMLTGLLYKPSWPASPASHFPLPPCSLSCLLLPQSPMAPVHRRRSATPPLSEDSSSWVATPRWRCSPHVV